MNALKFFNLIVLAGVLSACGKAPGATGGVAGIDLSPDASPVPIASPQPAILLAEPTNQAGPCSTNGGLPNQPICGGVQLHGVESDGFNICAIDASQNLYCWTTHDTEARVTLLSQVSSDSSTQLVNLVLGNYPQSGDANELACFTETDTNEVRCTPLQ